MLLIWQKQDVTEMTFPSCPCLGVVPRPPTAGHILDSCSLTLHGSIVSHDLWSHVFTYSLYAVLTLLVFVLHLCIYSTPVPNSWDAVCLYFCLNHKYKQNVMVFKPHELILFTTQKHHTFKLRKGTILIKILACVESHGSDMAVK